MTAARTTSRVLLVEDDDDTRDVMARLLSRCGNVDVDVVASVGAALVILEDSLPTHVLLDLMLPDASGVLVLQVIRRRKLPVRVGIVSAAGPDSAVMAQAMRLRPDVVFHKPVQFPEIEAWLACPRSTE